MSIFYQGTFLWVYFARPILYVLASRAKVRCCEKAVFQEELLQWKVGLPVTEHTVSIMFNIWWYTISVSTALSEQMSSHQMIPPLQSIFIFLRRHGITHALQLHKHIAPMTVITPMKNSRNRPIPPYETNAALFNLWWNAIKNQNGLFV